MAYTEKIAPNTPDSHQSTPWWLVAFVRFKHRDSLERNFTSNETVKSKKAARRNPAEEYGKIVIADSDVLSWNTATSKGSHVSCATVNLTYTNFDWLAAVAPDDWMFVWAFNNKEDYERVKENLKHPNGPLPCNKKNDGLKFMGRVDSVRKTKTREPMTGTKRISFCVTANGFVEFDSYIYYNPLVSRKYATMEQFMSDFGVHIERFTENGLVKIQYVIPDLLRICLGLGPGEGTKGIDPEAARLAGDTAEATAEANKGTALKASFNGAYRIPLSVAKILGRTVQQTKPAGYTYWDILTCIVGVQHYDGRGLVPKLSGNRRAGIYDTNDPLDGDALVQMVDFAGRSVWSILNTYLNAPVNEMYTSLRVGPSGDVVPHFICRQLPLSSPEFVSKTPKSTSFLSLPRWEIDDRLIYQIDTGRSSATRFNYVWVQSRDKIKGDNLTSQALALHVAPPIVDEADILRAGQRSYITTVSGVNVNAAAGPNTNDNPLGRWSRLMADTVMGGHLKYSGSIVCDGIQAPICEGDNVLVDGVLYHIERVTHQGEVNMAGTRTFRTTLHVTNGISIESERFNRTIYPDVYFHEGEGGSGLIGAAIREDAHVPTMYDGDKQ